MWDFTESVCLEQPGLPMVQLQRLAHLQRTTKLKAPISFWLGLSKHPSKIKREEYNIILWQFQHESCNIRLFKTKKGLLFSPPLFWNEKHLIIRKPNSLLMIMTQPIYHNKMSMSPIEQSCKNTSKNTKCAQFWDVCRGCLWKWWKSGA